MSNPKRDPAEFRQRVGIVMSTLKRVNALKSEADRFGEVCEEAKDRLWRAKAELQEARQAAYDAGHALADQLEKADKLPVLRLVQAASEETDFDKLRAAYSLFAPEIDAACMGPNPAEAARAAAEDTPGWAGHSEAARASAVAKPVITLNNSPNARVNVGNLSASAAGRDMNQQQPSPGSQAGRVKQFCKKSAWLGGIVVGIATLVAAVIEVVKWLQGR